MLDHDSTWFVVGTTQTFSNAYEVINCMQIKATTDCMKGIKISYVIKLWFLFCMKRYGYFLFILGHCYDHFVVWVSMDLILKAIKYIFYIRLFFSYKFRIQSYFFLLWDISQTQLHDDGCWIWMNCLLFLLFYFFESNKFKTYKKTRKARTASITQN